MTASQEKSGRLDALERWAGRCLGRHFFLCLIACALGQSAVALVIGYTPALHGSVSTEDVFHDVREYFEYADRTLSGEVPYRDFRIEYPPLGLVVFLVPRLFASTFGAYKIGLSLEMLAFNAATLVLAACWTRSRLGVGRVARCLAWYSAFFVLCNPTAMARYDLAAMFVAFAAARLLLADRPVAGGALTAASVLLKVFPGAAAAPAFLRELVHLRATRARGIISAAVVFGAGLGLWVAVGRQGVLRTLHYHAERGLEVGSIYAGLLMAAARLGGNKLPMAFDHLALHLETPTAMRVAALSAVVQVGAMLVALGAYWRSGMRDGLRYSTACLLACVVFGKVLSPQYLIWLIPFVACLEGRTGDRARYLFLIACGLTLLIFPLFFTYVAVMSRPGIVLLNARNLALVLLYGLLIFGRPARGDISWVGSAVRADPDGVSDAAGGLSKTGASDRSALT